MTTQRNLALDKRATRGAHSSEKFGMLLSRHETCFRGYILNDNTPFAYTWKSSERRCTSFHSRVTPRRYDDALGIHCLWLLLQQTTRTLPSPLCKTSRKTTRASYASKKKRVSTTARVKLSWILTLGPVGMKRLGQSQPKPLLERK